MRPHPLPTGAHSSDESGHVAPVALSAAVPASFRPEQLVHDRVRRFMKLLPEVLNSESAEAVHDLRVWSRRLQQVLATMFPKTDENRADPVIRTLRRARRGLSGWRDCDVLVVLLDKRLRRVRDLDEQRAWQAVRDYLARKREKEIRRARRRLARRELFTLPQTTQSLLKGPDVAPNRVADQADFLATLSGSIKAACADWEAALARAAESGGQTDTHAFRIKTKRVRYRIELARDLGYNELHSQLTWLKKLQDDLGHWHDRAELARIAIEAIADADFLLNDLRSASLMLKRLARERASETEKVKLLLASAQHRSELAGLETWIADHIAGADSASQSAPRDDGE
jgi:CHAD domain-containing protein